MFEVKMFNVNALVYKSEENTDMYVAECLEICQVAMGDTEADAKQDLIKTLEQVVSYVKEDESISLFGEPSERCRRGLQKALLEGADPEKISLSKLSVDFYREIN